MKISNTLISYSIFPLALIFFIYVAIPKSNDIDQYLIHLSAVSSQSFYDAFRFSRFEPLSALILWSVSKLFDPWFGFVTLGVGLLFVKFVIFRKYLRWPITAFIWYVCSLAYIFDANQIRVAIAGCVVIYVLLSSSNLQIRHFFSAGMPAVLMHYSSIVTIVVMASNRPGLLFLVTTTTAIVAKAVFVLLSDFTVFKMWFGVSTPASMTNPLFLMQAITLGILLVYWKSLNAVQRRGGSLMLVGTLGYVFFSEYPVIAHRLREFSQLGLLPLIFCSSCWRVVPRMTSRCFALSVTLYAFYDLGNKWFN